MSKTTVEFLMKNRHIDKKRIKPQAGYMEFHNGIYVVDPNRINRVRIDGKLKKGSEILFFEGNTSPIPLEDPSKTKKRNEDNEEDETQDPSNVFLDKMVYYNFLKQTGDPRADRMGSALRLIKPLTEPATLFKFIFALIIITSIIYGLLGEQLGWA